MGAKDVKILQLETQVCKLKAYNEDLSVQLKREPIEILKKDEDLLLEPKPIESPSVNVGINLSIKPRVVKNLYGLVEKILSILCLQGYYTIKCRLCKMDRIFLSYNTLYVGLKKTNN